MIRIKILVSYDGSCFYGWQKQAFSPFTVQNQLEDAWSKIYNQKISLMGAGRTDAGVHALGQVAHLDLPYPPSPTVLKNINSLLPSSIVCHCIWLAPTEFHAQRSAYLRTYYYVIFHTKTPPVINRNFGLWYPYPVDIKKLNEMSSLLLGERDFKSFQNKGTQVRDTVRKVKEASWSWTQKGKLVFKISANSFLKQMVRNLVGSQLRWMTETDCTLKMKEVLDSKSRIGAGKTIAPHGLFLESISYPHSLDSKCQRL